MSRPLKPYRLSAEGDERSVPTEFRIFPYGQVPTEKGNFIFTREDCAELMAHRAAQNAELEIDYEHQTYDDTPGPKPAAGWCSLEARDDGLWAVNVRWTETAKKLLQAAEYRYFSPTFRAHAGTKEILQLANLALTNIPAMRKIDALVAASVNGSKLPYKTTTKEKTMPAMHKLAGFLQKHMSENSIEPHTLAEKCGMDIERFRKLAAGEAPTPEEMTRTAKALSLSEDDIKSMSVDSRKAGDMETPEESDPDDVSDESTETTTHEAPDEGKEDTVPTSSRNVPDALDLVLLTGTSDPKKQAGFIKGLIEAAQVTVQLRDEVISLRKGASQAKREMLIRQGKEQGKLTPSLIKLFAPKPVEDLEAFLAVASPGGSNFAEPGREDAETAAVLSRQDRQVCELTMTDTKDFAQFVKATEKETVPWGDEGKFSKPIVESYLRPVEGSLVRRFKTRGATGRI